MIRQKFYGAKKPTNVWDVDVDSIIISNLIETKNNSKYLIGYLDKVIGPLVLIIPKLSGYVNTFKVKNGDRNNRFMYFHKNDGKLLENYRTIWTKIEDLKKY